MHGDSQKKSHEHAIDPHRVYVSFGQFNSREWHGNHTGIINRVIVDYKMYSNDISRNDNLAILILKTVVEYNAFIRPVCLWSGSTDLQDIVNTTGYITGWGYDMNLLGSLDYYNEEPRIAKVLFINFQELTSGDNILFYTTPQYSCYTDPGGGLVVFNTTTGRYELRGVMSYCYGMFGLANYINVAKLTFWIRQQISIT